MSNTTSAVRGAVYQYLSAEFPIAGRRMKNQIDITEPEKIMTEGELEDFCRAQAAIKKEFGARASYSAVLNSSFGASASSATTTSGKTTSKKSVSQSPMTSPKLGATTAAAANALRRQRSASPAKPKITATGEKKVVPKKKKDSDDDEESLSSDDDNIVINKKKPVVAETKKPIQQQKQQQQSYSSPPAAQKKPGERFCRIDVEKVKFLDERLRDNRPGEEATSFMQNAKMLAVRGKEFNKHKQKNKGKLYAAGVNQDIRSIKFCTESSDEE